MQFLLLLGLALAGWEARAGRQTAWPARPSSLPLIDEQKDEKLTMKKCVMAGALLTCNISSYHLETAGRAATSRLLPRLHSRGVSAAVRITRGQVTPVSAIVVKSLLNMFAAPLPL